MIVNFFLKLKDISDKNLLIFLCGLTFLFFSTVSIVRHFSLCSGGFDLGNFDQAVWNAAHGNSLFCTMVYNQGGTLLGDHFPVILFFMVPLYWLWSNVLVLLMAQSLLLACAIIPLYLIAKSVLRDRFFIFVFLVCYILSKPLRGVAFEDFHLDSFIVPLLFWAYYFLIKRNHVWLWVSIIILFLCKEDTTFLVLGLGLFALIIQKRQWIGISFIILAVFLWWLETGILIPYFSPTHNYAYLSKLPFGASYLDNLQIGFFHPLLFIKFLLTKSKITYVLKLLGPLCFLSLLSPPHYILIFIPLFKNLLATAENSSFVEINQHYVAGVVPFIFIAAIYGCHGLLQKLKIQKANCLVGLLLMGGTLLFYGKTDGCRLAQFLNNMKVNHTLEKIRSLDVIPPDASVLATDHLCPHLSHRKYIYDWGHTGGRFIFPEYIAIDRGVFRNEYLSPKENAMIDNYLSVAEAKGYKIISSVGYHDFMILEAPKT